MHSGRDNGHFFLTLTIGSLRNDDGEVYENVT